MIRFGSFGDTEVDVERGTEILQQFHNHATDWPEYRYTFPELVAHYTEKSPAFLDSLGFAANATGEFLTSSKTNDAMKALADGGQGQIPANASSFFNALNKSAQDYSWWGNVKYAATETGSQVGTGLQHVGETIIDVAEEAQASVGVWKYAIWLLPVGLAYLVAARLKGRKQ
jgi:hypothetical protein